MEFQRMPADGSGKVGYCQPGGVMASRSVAIEEKILEVTRADVARVRALAVDRDVTKVELVRSLLFLCHSAMAAADVAACRGERVAGCVSAPDVPDDSWKHGTCNLPDGHQGKHINDACHVWAD